MPAAKLQLRHDGKSLGIPKTRWQQALQNAARDDVVKIRHAPIEGTPAHRIHVAAVTDRVGCHFHASGNEDYAIAEGQGTLYWGAVQKNHDTYTVAWEEPLPVKAGDSFIVPEGYAHQMRNTGKTELIVLFACPDTHLDDTQDRFMIEASA